MGAAGGTTAARTLFEACWTNGPERHVLEWCGRAGVSCVQLSAAFLAASSGPRLHYNFDGHWTAAGHALAALPRLLESAAPGAIVIVGLSGRGDKDMGHLEVAR